ncbi:hypothetical protein D3C73_1436700 [compost metagenome]
MTKLSFITKHSGTVQKFTNALQKAQNWVKDHTPEEIADAVLPYFKDADKDVLVSAIKRYKDQDTYALNPVIDDAEWNNLLDVMDNAGELKERVPASKIVNNSFAEKALSEVKDDK